MTSRVYAIGLQGLEPPVPPAALAAGASREERASYCSASTTFAGLLPHQRMLPKF